MNAYDTVYQPHTVDPVRVHVASSDIPLGTVDLRRPRRGLATRSFLLNSNDPVQQILPQNEKRICAYIQAIGSSAVLYTTLADARTAYALSAQTTVRPDGGGYGSGVSVAPTAGTVIASIPAANLPAGRYLVRVNAGFGANPETTTDSNYDLVGSGGVLVASRLLVTGTGGVVRNWVLDNVAMDGNSQLKLVAHANASASSVYVGDITATPLQLVPPSTGGIVVPASNTAPYEISGTDPVWATSPGVIASGNPVVVCVTSVIED